MCNASRSNIGYKGVRGLFLFYLTTEQDDETPETSAADVSNGGSTETSPGPWFDRILGAFVCLLCFVLLSNTCNYNSTCQTLCHVLGKDIFFPVPFST